MPAVWWSILAVFGAMRAERSQRTLASMLPANGPELEVGEIPEEARFVRNLGCAASRQFEILELGTMFMLREVPSALNPTPGPVVATLPMKALFNAMAADVLKENDLLSAESK